MHPHEVRLVAVREGDAGCAVRLVADDQVEVGQPRSWAWTTTSIDW